MAKKRTSASSRLDDSWVVDDHKDDSDADWEVDEPDNEPQQAVPSRRNVGRRTPQPSSSTSGPDLIMPLYDNIDDRSRTSAFPQSSRPRNRAGLSASASKLPSRSQFSHAPKVKHEQNHSSSSPSGQQLTINALIDTGNWLREVIGHAAHYLKRPIGMILAAYLFCGLVVFLTNLLTNSIYTALSPICRVPGVSYLDLPICRPRNLSPTIDPSAPPEFDELIKTQDGFNSLIAESTDTISIPSSLKSGELSVRDLRSVVQYASVSVPSKEELLFEINDFIDLSRRAVQSLTQFNSHVGRSCDMVLSNGRWTQRALDDMATQDANTPRPNPIVRFLLQNLLHPFQPVQFTTSRLLDLYIQHTSKIESEIHTLLLEAQSLLTLLQSLEDRLDTIAAIAARGNAQINTTRDEILGHLWTMLGGNRAKLAKYANQLSILRDVSVGRKHAWRHVTSTILKLQEMAAEVEGLKERLSGAGSLPDHPEIPLSVHVESVRLGVERLDAGRQRAREVEREFVERRIEEGRDREGRGERWVIDG